MIYYERLNMYVLNSDEERQANRIIHFLKLYAAGQDAFSSDEELEFDSEDEMNGCLSRKLH